VEYISILLYCMMVAYQASLVAKKNSLFEA